MAALLVAGRTGDHRLCSRRLAHRGAAPSPWITIGNGIASRRFFYRVVDGELIWGPLVARLVQDTPDHGHQPRPLAPHRFRHRVPSPVRVDRRTDHSDLVPGSHPQHAVARAAFPVLFRPGPHFWGRPLLGGRPYAFLLTRGPLPAKSSAAGSFGRARSVRGSRRHRPRRRGTNTGTSSFRNRFRSSCRR